MENGTARLGGSSLNGRLQLAAFVSAIRPHQWLKNLLLFVPLVAAHRWTDRAVISDSFLAFLSFCFCASCVYLLNDWMDVVSDRIHPEKRFRPLASGALSSRVAIIGGSLLILCGVIAARRLGTAFLASVVLYLAVTTSYSLYLKQVEVLDLLCLAMLYTLRLLSGGIATEIAISPWLLSFSMFFFFSLACAKRVSELKLLMSDTEQKVPGRGYRTSDLSLLSSIGSSSGLMSVLVLALYVQSDKVVELYRRPNLLWFICPLVLYWLCRVWLRTHRGQMHSDPVVFAVKDRVSYVVGVPPANQRENPLRS